MAKKGGGGTIRSIGIGMHTNLSPLTRGLSSGFGQINSFAGKITSGFATAGLAISGFQTIAQGAWKLISTPIKSAMEAESIGVQFEVMTGSAEKATETIARLQKMGAETPFSFDDLSKSGSQLLSFGRTADEVVSDLGILTNIASGDANKLSSLGLVFGQIAAAGKANAGDIMQAINIGWNPLQNIMERTGETMGQVRDRLSAGKVSFDEIRQAAVDATTGTGRFAGMNEKQAATLMGLWSAFQDNFQQRITNLGTRLVEVFRFKDVLGSMSSFIESTQGTFDSFMDAFAAGFEEMTSIFQQFGNVIVARFNSIVETSAWLWNSISSFWESSGGPTFQTMKDFIFDSLVVIEFGFTNFWQLLKLGATQGLLYIVQFASAVQHQFTTVIPAYLSWFGENWQEIIGHMINQTIDRFSSFAGNLVSLFSKLPGLIAGTTDWSEVWTPFQATALDAVVDMPQIPDRVKGEFEKELAISVADTSNKLTESLGDLLNKRRSELLPTESAAPIAQVVAPPKKEEETTATKKSGDSSTDKILSGSMLGSKEAAESIIRHQMRSSGGQSKDPTKLQQDQVAIAKREEQRNKRKEAYLKRLADQSSSIEINLA